MTTETAAIVLAAGLGTRMKSDLPKVLHPLAQTPMINHVLDSLAALDPDRTVAVIGPDMEDVADAVRAHKLNPEIAIQERRLGTGHATLAAKSALGGFDGDVLVLFGDSPLITTRTLEVLGDVRRGADNPGVVVLGFQASDPEPYGRLMISDDGTLERIVEAKDATEEERVNDLCNSGVMAIDGSRLFQWLAQIGNDNAKNEYYLTDIIEAARTDGRVCKVAIGSEEELMGINSRGDLAIAEAILQDRLRETAMENGATLIDPMSVYLAWDTVLGRDVTIGPNVVFGPGVSVADKVEIRAFSHIEGAEIAEGAIIGPFARLRPGAKIGGGAHIGNFVEIKNALIGDGAKANHLSYIGDATIGARANIGAGTITCNYDGYVKSTTEIGAGAFIGSNTALVAPVKIGDGAVTGAGSVITKDVEADALAVTRGDLKSVAGWAAAKRKKSGGQK